MTATQDSASTPRFWLSRIKATRLILAAAALVFAGLWAFGALGPLQALAGFAIIAGAALAMSIGGQAARTAPVQAPPVALIDDPALIETLLAGLPDPAVALWPHPARATAAIRVSESRRRMAATVPHSEIESQSHSHRRKG